MANYGQGYPILTPEERDQFHCLTRITDLCRGFLRYSVLSLNSVENNLTGIRFPKKYQCQKSRELMEGEFRQPMPGRRFLSDHPLLRIFVFVFVLLFFVYFEPVFAVFWSCFVVLELFCCFWACFVVFEIVFCCFCN